MTDDLARLTDDQIADIRGAHRPVTWTLNDASRTGCQRCDTRWPCHAIRAVDAVETLATERDALRAELSAIHATTEWQRWARAVTERDAARAEAERLTVALRRSEDLYFGQTDKLADQLGAESARAERAEAAVRRVEALCDGSNWWPSGVHAVSVAAVRAALAGPGATT